MPDLGSGLRGVGKILLELSFLALERFDKKSLNLVPRPMGLTEEFKGGFYGRVAGEAADTNAIGELVPAIFLDEAGDDDFQGVAVEGVVWMGVHAVVVSSDPLHDDPAPEVHPKQ